MGFDIVSILSVHVFTTVYRIRRLVCHRRGPLVPNVRAVLDTCNVRAPLTTITHTHSFLTASSTSYISLIFDSRTTGSPSSDLRRLDKMSKQVQQQIPLALALFCAILIIWPTQVLRDAPDPARQSAAAQATTIFSRFPEDYYLSQDFVAKYALGAELGAGGNGFDLQARQRADGKEVAYWSGNSRYGRVPKDVIATDSVSHENIIIALLDVFGDDAYPYRNFVELYRSRCLEGRLRPNGRLSQEDANILIDAVLKIKPVNFKFGSMLRLPEGRHPSTGRLQRFYEVLLVLLIMDLSGSSREYLGGS
ncbi:hypothetical protein BDY19DRAFT_1051308 [Irpex rosettiformis]|uniref:Uncharacterized protein n=1 Tax=Irpex rosettiformis TaxID=378272 RepID=A0ACB8TQV2_9APHY|nr:hypothetical protein BDY19DRAFT_1051308 [Irpex rosettiformis]